MSDQESNTSQETPAPSAGGTATVKRLTRNTNDRVIAGVAGGLGRYFGVDPVLFRIGLVAAAFTGFGIVAYIACWILMPEEYDDPSAPPARRVDTSRLLRYVGIALIAIFLAGLIGDLLFNPFDFFWFPQAAFAAALIAVGLLLLRGDEPREVEAIRTTQPALASDEATTVPLQAAVPAKVRKPRERSPLGWLGLGLALLTLSGALIANRGPNVNVDASDIAGVFLMTMGGAVLIGAWWGRARWLIPIGIVVIPFAILFSAVNVPLRGEVGSFYVQPQMASDLEDYQLLAGDLTLDYTAYEFEPDAPVSTDISFVAGQVQVIVPPGVRVVANAHVVGGQVQVFDDIDRGLDAGAESASGAIGEGTLMLDIEGGFGDVLVDDSRDFLRPRLRFRDLRRFP